ncbi:MAG: fibronectin type III domain-containing protein [bacterium]
MRPNPSNHIVIGIALCLGLFRCGNDLQLTGFDESEFPSTPVELRVTVGDGKIILNWAHSNGDSVDYFNIYRQTDSDTVLALLDTTSLLTYTDTNVNNGVVYTYAISAVRNELEGRKARSPAAMPTVFGVIINSGAEFTKSRSVVLTMIAPVGATFMKIANDSLFTNAVFEPYLAAKTWTLTAEDGEKSVYVHYRDSEENETFRPLTDTIILDTKATILSISEDTGGATKSAGDVIRFTISTGETRGTASVDIGQALSGINLFDDGSNGDVTRDDGIYQRDFIIPTGLEVVDANVIGHFADQVGNIAEELRADGLITIQNPPAAVTLLSPETIQDSPTSLRLSWTQSSAQDFASYKLYRSTSPNVTTSSTFVQSIETITQLSYVDTDLEQNTTYYYKLYVFDSSGLSSASNEVSGNTLLNQAPKAVTLLTPVPVEGSNTSLAISWTKSKDDDFASYRLYRSTAPGVTDTSTFVNTVETVTTLSLVDGDLSENTTYYYVLYVFDADGLSAPSNEASGTTSKNDAPDPVTLFAPEPVQGSTTSLNLSWTQSNEDDFASYKLYRSLTQGVSTSSTFVSSVELRSTLSLIDDNLQENTTYYYKLYVFDTAGSSAASDEVSGTTLQDEPPDAVTLFSPEQIQGSTTSLNLSWTQSNADDFASYKLYRSLTPGVTTNSTFVTSIESRNTLSVIDENLQENTTYYYKLYVFDSAGNSAASDEVSGTTLQDEPPDAVTLFSPEPIQGSTTSLNLSWTQSNADDFASYKLYRSLTPGVTTNSTFVTSIESRTTLSLVDENLQENTTYYYRLYVFDTGGNSTASSEVSGTPLQNQPPTPVTLLEPETIADATTELRLAWSQNTDSDFASYKLYRSLTPGVSTASTFVTSIQNNATLAYLDEGLQEGTTYYYVIYVFDTGGLKAASNEVDATTPVNEPPTPPTLFDPEPLQESPTTLRLSWTQNNDQDFASYKIYRSLSTNVTMSSTFVNSIAGRTTLSYEDNNLQEGTTYFYKLYVFDTGGLSSPSNEVSGATLQNEPPAPVALGQPTQVNGTTLRLSWSQSFESDFDSYRVFRSEASPVDTTQAPVGIVNAASTTSFDDSSIDLGVDYFYRVFVFDKDGLSAGSNEVTGKLE